jgi:hypothetical protein
MTPFIPGAGPPLQTIARVFWVGVLMIALLISDFERNFNIVQGFLAVSGA